MKKIILESPIVQTFPADTIQAEVSHDFFSQKKMGLDIPFHYTLFALLKYKEGEDLPVLWIDPEVYFGLGAANTIRGIKEAIAACAEASERLSDLLISVNNKFKSTEIFADIFAPLDDVEKKRKYVKLDFMGHRTLLSDIINSGRLDWLNKLVEEYDIKSVTTSFYNFILDRNKYTHGELVYWYETKQVLLKYKNTSYVTEYGLVKIETLQSFMQCNKDLTDFLNKIFANF